MTNEPVHAMPRVTDTAEMIRGMAPRAVGGPVVFRTVDDAVPHDAVGWFREDEGLSVIVPADGVDATEPVMRQITLDVHSSLEGVGLTAAVASALARAGIACNVVAANHHDHVFVPDDRAEEALAILEGLAAEA